MCFCFYDKSKCLLKERHIAYRPAVCLRASVHLCVRVCKPARVCVSCMDHMQEELSVKLNHKMATTNCCTESSNHLHLGHGLYMYHITHFKIKKQEYKKRITDVLFVRVMNRIKMYKATDAWRIRLFVKVSYVVPLFLVLKTLNHPYSMWGFCNNNVHELTVM